MLIRNNQQYYIYIVTNPEKKVLYIGVTNNIVQRLIEHWINRGHQKTFAGRYFCCNLLYYESFQYVNDAITREKELKGWRRQKKIDLILTMNPDLIFLNDTVCNGWPPKEITNRL